MYCHPDFVQSKALRCAHRGFPRCSGKVCRVSSMVQTPVPTRVKKRLKSNSRANSVRSGFSARCRLAAFGRRHAPYHAPVDLATGNGRYPMLVKPPVVKVMPVSATLGWQSSGLLLTRRSAIRHSLSSLGLHRGPAKRVATVCIFKSAVAGSHKLLLMMHRT